MHRVACAAVLLLAAAASAREPTMAIAPVTTGQTAPAELQRAFADGLPRALGDAGFTLMPPNEVDMKVSERPEFVQCRSGGCLAEEATFLHVGRLALPRLERAPDGSFTVGISIYDAAQKRSIADAVERAAGPDDLSARLGTMAVQLRQDVSRPGRLEVRTEPAAALTVDGQAVGRTPWSGSLPPGDHVVALEANGERVERDVNVAPASTARVDLALATMAPPVHRRALRAMKWVTLIGGLLAVGGGAAMIALDGHQACRRQPGQRLCPNAFDTLIPGAATTAIGGALVVTGVILFAVDRPRR